MATVNCQMTIADLLKKFGPISIARIRTKLYPAEATEQDVTDANDREGRLLELYCGILVEKVMGFYESYLAILIAHSLSAFVDQRGLGIVAGEAGMIKLFPGEVRIPDVSFISWQRLPGGQIPREPIPLLSPDLVVEIISQGNTSQEMELKLREYFEAGVSVVWYVYPNRRVVIVYTSVTDSVEISENQSLGGGDVLPGFSLPLANLFNAPPSQPRPESAGNS